MERRKVLAGAGGIAAATIGGAALIPGGAAAQAEITALEDLAVTTDDGTVAWVAVGSQGAVDWEGLEAPADTFDYTVTLTVVDSGGNTVVDTELAAGGGPIADGFGRPEGSGDTGTRGTLSWDVPNPSDSTAENPCWLIVRNADLQDYQEGDDDYGAPEGSAAYTLPSAVDAGLFTVDEDGGSETYTFTKTMTVTIYDENGDTVEASAGSEFDLTVTNVESGTTSTSSGDVSAGGDPDKTA